MRLSDLTLGWAASGSEYGSPQRTSRKAFSPLPRYSRTERTSVTRPFEGNTSQSLATARPVRGNYPSVLGNGPSNDNRDIVRTTGIESILNKILGQLARRFHPGEPLSDARIRDVPSEPVAAEEVDRPPGIRNPGDDGRCLLSADRAGENVRQR